MAVPTTVDAFLEGALVLEQPAPGHGYRVNADSLLLARFAARARPAPTVVDLGAGVGAVALALHTLDAQDALILVEGQPALAELARRNVHRAGLDGNSCVIEDDVAAWSQRAPALDCVVVSNPPYTPPGSGRRGTEPVRDAARHGCVMPFLEASGRILSRGGSAACLCYPASSLVDLLVSAEQHELQAVRLCFVHPAPGLPARIALVELHRTPTSPLVVEPPTLEAACERPEDR
jgi:tRNA1(Val) A37 N6-methylase TrmN6